uniref:F1F0-ATPase inhibitor protein n=1 Tax=Oryza glumipatula TaxID=40148 RepID=A0A0E0B6T7_9ORYZ
MEAAARAPSRAAARFVQRRLFSSGGKVLGEEEKAAENVYIKKMEHEKLEKLAHKGPNPGEQASTAGAAANAVKTGSGSTESRSAGVSTDKNRNYAVLAGTVAALSGLGWYLLSKPKKSEEIVD